jgi:hypothetical protein
MTPMKDQGGAKAGSNWADAGVVDKNVDAA